MPTATASERSVPHNLEAERALLGTILLDNSALDAALEVITKDDLYSEAHRLTFETMQALNDKARVIDLVTLSEELAKEGLLEKAGGAAYLAALTDGVPIGTTAAMGEYCRIVKEKSTLRQLINAANGIVLRAMEGEDPGSLQESAQKQFYEIGEQRTKADFRSFKEIFQGSFKRIDALFDRKTVTGIETGLSDLDKMTTGFQHGELVLLAARPSQGKTALGLNVATYNSRRGIPVGFFSLEMSNDSLLLRLMASEAGVDLHKLRSGFTSAEDWRRMTHALGKLSESPLYINDTSALTINQVRSKARRLKAEKGINLLIVDYLQLVSGGKAENRNQEVGKVSRGLKAIAKELEIPVLALCQLGRSAEQREEPQLSDLRESGDLDADADLVIFIFKPKRTKDDTDEEDYRTRMRLKVGKQRNGPCGHIDVRFLREYTRFRDLTTEEAPLYDDPKMAAAHDTA